MSFFFVFLVIFFVIGVWYVYLEFMLCFYCFGRFILSVLLESGIIRCYGEILNEI